MRLVLLVEEPSMKTFLGGLLHRMQPEMPVLILAHEGKADLERSIPRKLRAWRDPEARFVIIRDQDAADCRAVKAKLQALCGEANHPDALVRIACRELEAFYLGDPAALARAYGSPKVEAALRAKKFLQPDALPKPSAELRRLVPAFSKSDGARRMALEIDLENSRSESFLALVRGLRRLVAGAG